MTITMDQLDRPTSSGHSKRLIHLRGYLAGCHFFRANQALDFALSHHDGMRRDGVTPEFAHQVYIASLLITLMPHLRDPENTLIVVFLHDIVEDKGVTLDEVERRFGRTVREAVDAMSKEIEGVKKTPEAVAAAQASDPIASVVKGADRIHNHQTMAGVFTSAKIMDYLAETRAFILPMLKLARRNFPDQYGAYQNLKTVLFAQVEILEAAVGGLIQPL